MLKKLCTLSLLLLLASTSSALTLNVENINVKKGQISEQSLNVLNSQKQAGTEDDWNEYIEFSPNSKKFVGEFTFTLPSDMSLEDVEALTLNTNFIGEIRSSQRWLFKIRDQKNQSWLTVGDNSDAKSWRWKEMLFNISQQPSDFITDQNQIIVRYQSNNSLNISNLDYLAIEVTEKAGDPSPSPEPAPEPAPEPSPEPEPESPRWMPSPSDGLTWQWQLQGNINHSYNVDVYDVDLFDVSTDEIAQLKNEGRIVICYFSAGTYEGWRDDWADNFDFIDGDTYSGSNPPFAGKMADWDERWLDISRIDLLAPIMTSRLDLAVEKGCDAVEPDNVDAWSNAEEVKLSPALTANDQLKYNRWLAKAAHDRGLSIGLKNNVEQLADLVEDFDWALNEQCFQYKECDEYSVFINAGKAVFGVEYTGDIETICNKAIPLSLFWMKKRLSLNDWRQGCDAY